MAESEGQSEQTAVEKADDTSRKTTAKKAKKTAKKATTRRRPAKKRKTQDAASGAKREKPVQNADGATERSPSPADAHPDTAKQEEEPNVEAVAEPGAAPAAAGAAPSEESESVQTGEEKPGAAMQWGRRSKRTGPILREDVLAGRVVRPIAAPQKNLTQAPSAPGSSEQTRNIPAEAESGTPKVKTEMQPVAAPEQSPAPSPVEQQVAASEQASVPSPVEQQVAASEQAESDLADDDDDLDAEADPETEQQGDALDQDNRRSRRRRRRGRDRDRRSEDPRNRPEGQGQRSNEDARNRGDAPRNEDVRNRSENQSQRGNEDRNRPDQQRRENQGQRSNEDVRNRGRDERAESRPSRSLADLIAEAWTEDKARRFLSEGLLAQLSPRLLGQSETRIPDPAALREPLRMIRKVLADECMVADDAVDVMLLDLVMNALIDRIDVCRLQAKSQSPEDIEVLLDLRYKADRRLIEALNALKNA